MINKLKIELIKSNPNNPRIIRDEKFHKLVKSIKEFPEMLDIRPIVVDENMIVLGGNMRLKACKEAGLKEVPVIMADNLSEAQKKEFVIKDNASFGEWDWDILEGPNWDISSIEDWGIDVFNTPVIDFSDDEEDDKNNNSSSPESDIQDIPNEEKSNLADRFIVPPFSILDTRQGYWQSRKDAWKELGIKSEVGRNENLLGYSDTMLEGFSVVKYPGGRTHEDKSKGTSIFDPVLTEISYRWFCNEGGKILDPFAGGSVRGIVASKLGFEYTGIELRKEQVEANEEQANEICSEGDIKPKYITGSSERAKEIADGSYDMIFTCPPYYDLEVYSEDPEDLSNMEYEEFEKAYDGIIEQCIGMLKDDSFSVFVVGDVRDKKGFYLDFIGKTIQAHEKAGAKYYNQAILMNAVGMAAMKAGRNFATRKLTKVHQNVLIFFKGDPKNIKDKFGSFDASDSFEEADSFDKQDTEYGEKITFNTEI